MTMEYKDFNGRRIDVKQWGELLGLPTRFVGREEIETRNLIISTAWIGIDTGSGEIFETMLFYMNEDGSTGDELHMIKSRSWGDAHSIHKFWVNTAYAGNLQQMVVDHEREKAASGGLTWTV